MPQRSSTSTPGSSSSRLRPVPAVTVKVDSDSDDEIQIISHTPAPGPTPPPLVKEIPPEAFAALRHIFQTSETARASLQRLATHPRREAAPPPETRNSRSWPQPSSSQVRASALPHEVITVDDSDDEVEEVMPANNPQVPCPCRLSYLRHSRS